ncbi:cupredoxin domain-containing protein [Tepidiforma sp.]|uniref:cupredoxin domain-containing protein n=1 Tax=Tepidiforma sp. TaxID=2682230 RepID=UPI002ADD5F54|nr:cupredoxin domain-containing protein [Tepidiforma sp.]
MNRRILLPLAALPLLLSAVPCSESEGRPVDVVLGENTDGSMYMRPASISFTPGETITFYVKNEGSSDHEFESDEAGIEEVIIPRGRTRKVTWKAPQSGSYPVYCDMAGHRAAGMEATLGPAR